MTPYRHVAPAPRIYIEVRTEFPAEALRISGGEGVHVVYDGSGPRTFQGSLDALRRCGTFCWYSPVLGGRGAIDVMSLPKSIKLDYAVFTDHIRTPVLLRERTARLFEWIRSGDLKVTIGAAYRLVDEPWPIG